MSPEREPMENDSNSRTAEELEQQTVDVYVERALHGPVFRMSYPLRGQNQLRAHYRVL